MTPALRGSLTHARAMLGLLRWRPVALPVALTAPLVMLPWLGIASNLPLPLVLVGGIMLGGAGQLVLELCFTRSQGWPRAREPERTVGLPTLPLSPRARAVGETLAALPVLVAGMGLSFAVVHLFGVAAPGYSAEIRAELAPDWPLALIPFVLPGTLSAALQMGRHPLAQVVGTGLPGVLAALAWHLGLLDAPGVAVALALLATAAAFAVGPLPAPPPLGPLLPRVALRRPGRSPARAFLLDLLRGIPGAHLRVAPMALVGLAPVLILFGNPSSFALGTFIAVFAVALSAAFLPLGRTPFGVGAGRAADTPWAHLPVAPLLIRWGLYGHALVCVLALPLAVGALWEGWNQVVLGLLGVAAPGIAAALLAVWLGHWRRAAVAITMGLALLLFSAFRYDGLPPWGPAIALSLAGTLPVLDLLLPRSRRLVAG